MGPVHISSATRWQIHQLEKSAMWSNSMAWIFHFGNLDVVGCQIWATQPHEHCLWNRTTSTRGIKFIIYAMPCWCWRFTQIWSLFLHSTLWPTCRVPIASTICHLPLLPLQHRQLNHILLETMNISFKWNMFLFPFRSWMMIDLLQISSDVMLLECR
jgi:hypothetical protein